MDTMTSPASNVRSRRRLRLPGRCSAASARGQRGSRPGPRDALPAQPLTHRPRPEGPCPEAVPPAPPRRFGRLPAGHAASAASGQLPAQQGPLQPRQAGPRTFNSAAAATPLRPAPRRKRLCVRREGQEAALPGPGRAELGCAGPGWLVSEPPPPTRGAHLTRGGALCPEAARPAAWLRAG
ncbi:vacuolar protein sorting-associated protein 33B [Platysternon megacephalum]|uniref:Vacuolar protein sorting-associated protein 33B n=1 Tax=Platysternon megacephalum TaxID=55544 RepID=A0A4D9ED32_9SAUR|nr:vacuolar protein sorting-associated protein 33B [Platysternon megacephalum]